MRQPRESAPRPSHGPAARTRGSRRPRRQPITSRPPPAAASARRARNRGGAGVARWGRIAHPQFPPTRPPRSWFRSRKRHCPPPFFAEQQVSRSRAADRVRPGAGLLDVVQPGRPHFRPAGRGARFAAPGRLCRGQKSTGWHRPPPEGDLHGYRRTGAFRDDAPQRFLPGGPRDRSGRHLWRHGLHGDAAYDRDRHPDRARRDKEGCIRICVRRRRPPGRVWPAAGFGRHIGHRTHD